MNQNPILRVEDLSVTIEREKILENISFTVMPGDVVALIGPNGAGKTVLLRSLLGLMPYRGGVHWSPDAIIGYVPQRYNIGKSVPLTVREFFLLHERKFIFAGLGADKKIMESLALVDMPASVLGERLGNLSGGELQRVLIAWALYDKPNILLFDEPTAGIDVSGEQTIYNLLHSLQDRFGITILLFSHELNVVFRYATQVLCLNKTLVCSGEPETVLTPEKLASLYGEPTPYPHMHNTKEAASGLNKAS